MEELNYVNLNGVNNEYERFGLSVKKSLFYDEVNNNLFLFSSYGDCDVEDIVNGISGERYDYLTKVLNTNRNLIIDWSTQEGTTSDYIIYHGFDAEFIENSLCPEMLSMELGLLQTADSGYENYKYQEYKNGKFNQLF
ncbi:hypothetical protein [Lysinibacillus sp. Bpr_S20]|uniref:hypothetical protein n=1 Tax=Lysinibacillus sp. Bpr_S20 TaxID=2933964 RepID=UPI00201374F7|nr:hypothetical protein [Lysinibacillus sp. Bpr_S20]MCL1700696.1 hypothetical protein [Lysinibacillus sp. Bpr_S20]